MSTRAGNSSARARGLAAAAGLGALRAAGARRQRFHQGHAAGARHHAARWRRLQCGGGEGPAGFAAGRWRLREAIRRPARSRGEGHRQQAGGHADQHALASGADRFERSRRSRRWRDHRARSDARNICARPIASVDYEGLYGPLAEGRAADRRPRAPRARWSSPASRSSTATCPPPTPTAICTSTSRMPTSSWPAARCSRRAGRCIDYRNGAWLGGLVRAHEKLAQLARPDTRIVPANGGVISGSRHPAPARRCSPPSTSRWWSGRTRAGIRATASPRGRCKDFEAQYGDPAAFIHGAFLSLNLAYSPD